MSHRIPATVLLLLVALLGAGQAILPGASAQDAAAYVPPKLALASQNGFRLEARISATGYLSVSSQWEQGPRFPDPWVHIGAGFGDHHGMGWASVDIAVTQRFDFFLAATTNNGELYTAMGYLDAGAVTGDYFHVWQPLQKMGQDDWSVWAAPSIDAVQEGPRFPTEEEPVIALLGAVKEDGRLYTIDFSGSKGLESPLTGEWRQWAPHGQPNWTRVDVALGRDIETVPPEGTQAQKVTSHWMLGTKADGRLYSRAHFLGEDTTWDGFDGHGVTSWSTSAEPVIVAGPTQEVAIGAVKADGRLYTRELRPAWSDEWQPFVRHGQGQWAGVDLAHDGVLYVLAVKINGDLWSRSMVTNGHGTSFFPWVRQGRGGWDDNQLAISANSGESTFIVAGKADGRVFARTLNERGWGHWM